MSEHIFVRIMGNEPVKVSVNTTLDELSVNFQHLFGSRILLAKVDNELYELRRTLSFDCSVEFMDITNPNGFRAYQKSVVFMMVCAAKDVLGKKARIVVKHSLNKNYYCEIPDFEVNDDLLSKIGERMRKLVELELPIEKLSIPREKCMMLAAEAGLNDKLDIMKFKRSTTVSFYKLDWFYNYFYGPMVINTKLLSKFGLSRSDRGFMLQFPSFNNPDEMLELKTIENITKIYHESSEWAGILKVDTVGALNRAICDGGFESIIRISEALHEKKIAYIADMINEKKKKIILVAGPSSSGKTTFAMRLCVQLRAVGLRPHVISLDNYFFNRVNAPKDANGMPDYDCLDFMDRATLNRDLTALLKGQNVELPSYNFHTGEREYLGNVLRLDEDEVLVLEGIHALNDKLTDSVPESKKFKVFISPMTQINIDDHNRMATSDSRLIRRITRDYQFRGTDARLTIQIWPKVQYGEAVNIFPFQKSADVIFNSALVYEMCVIKQFVLPLLFGIEKSEPEYVEATRLIKSLGHFLGATSENIPKNSILREFIGGSCFET